MSESKMGGPLSPEDAARTRRQLEHVSVAGSVLDAVPEVEPASPTVKKWTRSNFVPAPHFFNLNHACRLVNDAFGGHGCYLVGSALHRRDHRDVDVRYIMDDEQYDRMFRGGGGWLNAYWSLLCQTISLWLSQQTGLQVDFQIQQQTRANAQHDGPRHALGIFHDYPGERPSDGEPR